MTLSIYNKYKITGSNGFLAGHFLAITPLKRSKYGKTEVKRFSNLDECFEEIRRREEEAEKKYLSRVS